MITESHPDQRLTLEDIKSALRNPEAETENAVGNIEALYELARDKQALAKKIAGNTELMRQFGNEEEILRALDALEHTYEEQIQTIEAGKLFAEKIEKQSWGKWALDKVKAVVKFPAKHPIIFLLILIAILASIAGYVGYLPGLGSTFSAWAQKAKALFGFEATAATETAAGALEAAHEAATVANIPIHIIESDVFYNGTKYGISELPELLKTLPKLAADQKFSILRYESARVSAENALKDILTDSFSADSWVMPDALIK